MRKIVLKEITVTQQVLKNGCNGVFLQPTVNSSTYTSPTKSHIYHTWDLKHLFINGCFNYMIPSLYIGNGCLTISIHFKLVVWGSRYVYIKPWRQKKNLAGINHVVLVKYPKNLELRGFRSSANLPCKETQKKQQQLLLVIITASQWENSSTLDIYIYSYILIYEIIYIYMYILKYIHIYTYEWLFHNPSLPSPPKKTWYRVGVWQTTRSNSRWIWSLYNGYTPPKTNMSSWWLQPI